MSAREWKAGDVAKWPGMGVVICVGRDETSPMPYQTKWANRWGGFSCYDGDEIRPLVVIDPEQITGPDETGGEGAAEEIVKCLRRLAEGDHPLSYRRRVAELIAAEIEAQACDPTPPRIEEPGQFGVVEASCVHSHGRRHWVKGGNGNWYPVDNDETAPDDWDSLIEPVLVREGVPS